MSCPFGIRLKISFAEVLGRTNTGSFRTFSAASWSSIGRDEEEEEDLVL